jgi:transcriptional regulator with XRE-family HTH domain
MNRAEQIRIDRGLGVVGVAAGAGISTRTLKKVERGDSVTAAALARLATFYEVKASTLQMPAVDDRTTA